MNRFYRTCTTSEHYTVNPPLYMSENAGDIFYRLKIISFSQSKNYYFLKRRRLKQKLKLSMWNYEI